MSADSSTFSHFIADFSKAREPFFGSLRSFYSKVMEDGTVFVHLLHPRTDDLKRNIDNGCHRSSIVVSGRCCTVAVRTLAATRLLKPIATVEFPLSGNRRKGTPVLRRTFQVSERPIPIVEYFS